MREADRVISAIAARLRELGLPTDAVVGIQLPNTVESVLTLLGVLRAGMIAAPLPLLWRRADAAAALGRLGASAIVTTSRIGDFDACATGDAGRGGDLYDPLRLRLRRQSAGRRDRRSTTSASMQRPSRRRTSSATAIRRRMSRW